MNAKTVVITGANAGLGFETALALAKKGGSIFMICRSEERGHLAKEQIIQQSNNDQIHLVMADLASQKSVREAASLIQEQKPVIDVLINNAGLVSSHRQLSKEGIELQFAVNHLAHFLLTHLLFPSLQKSPESRIVNISSANHFRGAMHFDDLNLSNNYAVLKAYNQSKLANVLFTYELDRRLKEKKRHHMSVHAVDPGLNNTGIGQKHASWLHGLVWWVRRRQGMHPGEGAANQVYVASAPEVIGQSGKYWVKQKAVPSSALSYQQEDAKKLWEISAELTNINTL